MQLNFFLYVKRNWREDQISLSQFVEYYQKLNYDYRLVLFPEGTDLSSDNRRRSAKFAAANNYQVTIASNSEIQLKKMNVLRINYFLRC